MDKKREIEDYINRILVERGLSFRFEVISLSKDGSGILYHIRPLDVENPDYMKSIELADKLLESYGLRGLE